MKINYLLGLRISYGYLIFLFGIFAVLPPHAYIRALLLFTAFAYIVIMHIIILRSIEAGKINKGFFILSLLWGIKLVTFAVNEGLNLSFQEGPIALEWVDLFLLFILAIITSISFLFKKPFWYKKLDDKSSLIIGILSLIFSGWITLQIIFTLLDYLKIN